MQLSPNGYKLLKQLEACKLEAYKDVGGVWTIGWGSTGPDIKECTVWTQDQADMHLVTNIGAICRELTPYVSAKLTQCEADAIIIFSYNVGVSAFAHSTMCKLINSYQMTSAALEFAKWNHVNGKEVEGLTNRRAAERALFEGKAV